MKLNRNIPLALYFQIEEYLRKMIKDGVLNPGDAIPTEKELQNKLNVSRATVRQAVANLVYEGILQRRRPKGTFVTDKVLKEDLSTMNSFTKEAIKHGFVPSSKIISFEIIEASDELAKSLEISKGDKVACIERIRYLDKKPTTISLSQLPLKFADKLSKKDFDSVGDYQSLYYILETKYGVKLHHGEEDISAILLDKRKARLLKLEDGSPAILLKRIVWDENGYIVDISRSVSLTHYRINMIYKK